MLEQPNEPQIQYVFNGDGKPVGVIVPLDLWQEICLGQTTNLLAVEESAGSKGSGAPLKERELNTEVLFHVTEWDWLKLQLRLHAMEFRVESEKFYFNFTDSPAHVHCLIWCDSTQSIIDYENDSDSAKLFSYEELCQDYYIYCDMYVSSKRNQIKKILAGLPNLSREFDVFNDVTFEFLYSYGMGSTAVCEYNRDGYFWRYPETKID